MKVKWQSRTFFAEVAEALKIPTDQILAAWRKEDDGPVFVLYSTDAIVPDPLIYEATLGSEDGVLVPVGEPRRAGRFSEIAGRARR